MALNLRHSDQEGIADGSLRSDLDPNLTLHAVMNAIVGAQRRLASLGTKVEVEYGQSVDRLFREVIRILEFGLRATASPAVPVGSYGGRDSIIEIRWSHTGDDFV